MIFVLQENILTIYFCGNQYRYGPMFTWFLFDEKNSILWENRNILIHQTIINVVEPTPRQIVPCLIEIRRWNNQNVGNKSCTMFQTKLMSTFIVFPMKRNNLEKTLLDCYFLSSWRLTFCSLLNSSTFFCPLFHISTFLIVCNFLLILDVTQIYLIESYFSPLLQRWFL